MGIYKKASSLLVFDLINQDNPQLPVPLSPDNCYLGTPTAVTPVAPDYRNTSITVYPKRGVIYTGVMTLTYRRLDFGSLTANSAINYPVMAMFTTGSTSLTLAQFVATLNDRYDLALDVTDFNAQSWGGPAAQLSAVFASSNPAWIGRYYFTWTRGDRPLSDALAAGSGMGSLIFPDSVVGQVGAKPLGQLITAGMDFSAWKASLDVWPNGSSVQNGDAFQPIMGYLSSKFDLNLTYEAGTVVGGIQGLICYRYSLPNAAVPEADSARFNRCLVIMPVSTTWFQGKMIFHYNV